MKNGKEIYYYIASSLAMLVPVPGRFAYGIFVIVLFNIQMVLISMLVHGIEKLNLSVLKNAIISLTLIAITILYKQILTLICPIAALTLGFCIYLPALTSAVIEFFFSDYEKGMKKHLAVTLKKSSKLSACVLVYYLLRDLIGYGTLTLPSWKTLFVLHLPYNPESTQASMFMATIPGSLVFIAILLTFYIIYRKKMEIYRNSKEASSEASGEEK
ncbi:MAG: hypothetical protein KBT11_11055 [Treponema sp.]|nr:hypothetical protein [Candidatus Treponema equifaecale]